MRNEDLSIEQAKPAPSPIEGAVPADVELVEETGKSEQSVLVASQWRLMWWKFKRHKLAMGGLIIVILLYLIAIFAELLAPADPNKVNASYTYAPPQGLGLFREENGERVFGLYVNGYKSEIDQETLAKTFTIDEE
ncbi:MAG TPA: hypothetical protein VD789_09850, partial [Thermomicrobiales bacterium]|nr:hypothetical protein [Thermomicrobiales bacterium]